jgi:hypothetical protein
MSGPTHPNMSNKAVVKGRKKPKTGRGEGEAGLLALIWSGLPASYSLLGKWGAHQRVVWEPEASTATLLPCHCLPTSPRALSEALRRPKRGPASLSFLDKGIYSPQNTGGKRELNSEQGTCSGRWSHGRMQSSRWQGSGGR